MIKARRRRPLALDEVTAVVCAHFGLHESDLRRRSHLRLPRATFVWLARRYTDQPLRELATRVGLARADCVPSLLRFAEQQLDCFDFRAELAKLRRELERIAATAGQPVVEKTNPKV